jgi:hypothetical protein
MTWRDLPGIVFFILFLMNWIYGLVSLLRWGAEVSNLPGRSAAPWHARRNYVWANTHLWSAKAVLQFRRVLISFTLGVGSVGLAIAIGGALQRH